MKLCGLLKLNILSIAQIYVLLIFLPVGVWAHSGGLDSSGCHGGSKPYHCHRSSSEMTKSSSGGNRLKCSYGSESKDCNSGTNTQSTNTINEALTVGTVKNPDGESITLFGFNFDKDQDAALVALEEKFNCRLMLSVYIGSCHGAGVNTVFTYIIDALGAIKTITFKCETFGGCIYTPVEIFEALSAATILVGDVDPSLTLCDYGVAGEKICVNEETKSVTLYRDRFRQKPMSFD